MISIINYGLGNINAFANIYKRLKMKFKIASKADELKNSTKLILPGVGSFDQAVKRLKKSGINEMLDELVLQYKVPILGVCVGMQILGLSSEEGDLPGLGWIDGKVKKFDKNFEMNGYNIPHMGWNQVEPYGNNKLFKNLNKEDRFYFLHSYYFSCHKRENVIAVTDYGIKFAAAVNSKNIYGVQFHPEKSHSKGIQLLKNFGQL